MQFFSVLSRFRVCAFFKQTFLLYIYYYLYSSFPLKLPVLAAAPDKASILFYNNTSYFPILPATTSFPLIPIISSCILSPPPSLPIFYSYNFTYLSFVSSYLTHFLLYNPYKLRFLFP